MESIWAALGLASNAPRRVFRMVKFTTTYGEAKGTPKTSWKDATAITSEVVGSDLHAPVFDFDYPCELVESTTPGHYHLYLNGPPITKEAYMEVLSVMAKHGLVQTGYANAAKDRGFATLRLPWVKKEIP